MLVHTFYEKVRINVVLGYIFDGVAKIDWEHHLTKMYSFRASLLLDEPSFSGNPMLKHIELSKHTPLTKVEFSEWLLLFGEKADELFEGETTEEAKTGAANRARFLLHKVQTQDKRIGF